MRHLHVGIELIGSIYALYISHELDVTTIFNTAFAEMYRRHSPQ